MSEKGDKIQQLMLDISNACKEMESALDKMSLELGYSGKQEAADIKRGLVAARIAAWRLRRRYKR